MPNSRTDKEAPNEKREPEIKRRESSNIKDASEFGNVSNNHGSIIKGILTEVNSTDDEKEPVLSSNREEFVKIGEEDVVVRSKLLIMLERTMSPDRATTSGSSSIKRPSFAPEVSEATRPERNPAIQGENRFKPGQEAMEQAALNSIIQGGGMSTLTGRRRIGSIRRDICNSKRPYRLRDSKERNKSLDGTIPPDDERSLKGAMIDISPNVVKKVEVDESTIIDDGALTRAKGGPVDPRKHKESIKEFGKRGSSLDQLSKGISRKISKPKIRESVESGLIVSIDKRKSKLIRNVNVGGDEQGELFSSSKSIVNKVIRRLGRQVQALDSPTSSIVNETMQKVMVTRRVLNVTKEPMSSKKESNFVCPEINFKFGGDPSLQGIAS